MIPAMVDLLAVCYQTGNLDRMEAIARSMLAAIPDDVVALQFLGLALYLRGRVDDAYRAFRRVATGTGDMGNAALPTTCESAAEVSYREATRPESGLAEGWQRIAAILRSFRFPKTAARALEAAAVARGAAASQ